MMVIATFPGFSMNHPRFELTAICGGDDVLTNLDGRREFVRGAPRQEGLLTRFLKRFRPEPSAFRPTRPDVIFAAGENAAAFAMDRVGVDRLMGLLNAGPRARQAMEAHLAEEWAPVQAPAPDPFRPANRQRARATPGRG